MVEELSNDTAHKLQAVLSHDRTDVDKDFPAGYLAACARWYAALSGSDRVVAILAASEFAKGNELEAARIATALPPAPMCQLHH